MPFLSETLQGPSPTSRPSRRPLNEATFAPFAVVAREPVSPTAFLLTVEPAPSSPARAVAASAAAVRRARRHGLWSVEIKQPQIQVAREYTPLPEVAGGAVVGRDGGDGDGDGDDDDERKAARMTFLIRKMPGGEVSGYLARLRVGDVVEIRGPRLGFDLRERVGVVVRGRGRGRVGGEEGEGREEEEREETKTKKKKKKKKKVVFLAGGTGIAPALQAASALLFPPPPPPRDEEQEEDGEAAGVEMEIVWANRRREDCVGCGGAAGSSSSSSGEGRGAVVAMLEELRRRSGGRLRYACTVDEEGSFIGAGTIERATGMSTTSVGRRSSSWWWWWWWWPFSGSATTTTTTMTTVSTDACPYHSAKKLVASDDRDDLVGADGGRCQCRDGEGRRVAGGKNLLMISGPDGFIARYVGATVWGAGKELQGPVRGVVGELRRKYPGLAEDWLVLKN